MPQRLAITAASVVATAVLTVGLVAAGFVPPSDPSTAADPQTEAPSTTDQAALEPEVVYVKPAPKPKTIVLKKQATTRRAASSTTRTPTVVAAPRRSDDDGDERHERGEERDD